MRISTLPQDAQVLCSIFKYLGVLLNQPRNRTFSRLKDPLESMCSRKVRQAHLFQIQCVFPGALDLKRHSLDGHPDLQIRPLQNLNLAAVKLAFVEALEKVQPLPCKAPEGPWPGWHSTSHEGWMGQGGGGASEGLR